MRHVQEAQLRFDFEALEPLLVAELPELCEWTAAGWGTRTTPAASAQRVGDLCGVSYRTVYRWRRGQGLSSSQADRAAVALGLHPCQIWPTWDELHDTAARHRAARRPAHQGKRDSVLAS